VTEGNGRLVKYSKTYKGISYTMNLLKTLDDLSRFACTE
jgi:hypothetical protein